MHAYKSELSSDRYIQRKIYETSVFKDDLALARQYRPKIKLWGSAKIVLTILGGAVGVIAIHPVFLILSMFFTWFLLTYLEKTNERNAETKRRKLITLMLERREVVNLHRKQVKELNKKIRAAKSEQRLKNEIYSCEISNAASDYEADIQAKIRKEVIVKERAARNLRHAKRPVVEVVKRKSVRNSNSRVKRSKAPANLGKALNF